MPYSIANLKDDLSGMLQGTSLSKVTNLYNLFDRAGRDLLAEVDPQETKRTATLPILYDKTYDYAAPADLKGNRVIDIRPMAKRYPSDQLSQTYSQFFDVYKDWLRNGGLLTTNFNTGVKSLRLAKNMTAMATLNSCDGLADNGTWVAGGDVTDLIADTVTYVAGSGSLRFSLSGAGTTGYVENSTMDSLNLEDDEDLGSAFLYAFLPTGSAFTSVSLRWGSSSSDYWEKTMTVNNVGAAFQDGWDLLGFLWQDATETGSPDATDVTYLRVSFAYDGDPIANVRVDHITMGRGKGYEIDYYSKYLFRNAVTGAFIENVAADTNLVNLDTDSYNLLTYRCAYLAAQQIQGQDSAFDLNFAKEEWKNALDKYRAKNKSEVQKPTQPYYRMPRVRGRYSGYGFNSRLT